MRWGDVQRVMCRYHILLIRHAHNGFRRWWLRRARCFRCRRFWLPPRGSRRAPPRRGRRLRCRCRCRGVRNAAETARLERARNDIVAADPYDAATALEAVRLQTETLYSVTARLSQLRLSEYLK